MADFKNGQTTIKFIFGPGTTLHGVNLLVLLPTITITIMVRV